MGSGVRRDLWHADMGVKVNDDRLAAGTKRDATFRGGRLSRRGPTRRRAAFSGRSARLCLAHGFILGGPFHGELPEPVLLGRAGGVQLTIASAAWGDEGPEP
jgi:hypothetical protein